MIIPSIAYLALLQVPALPSICTVEAQQAWEQLCYSSMKPTQERRSTAWSNADVWLTGEFLDQYLKHCQSGPPSSNTPKLDAYYRRASDLAAACSLDMHANWVRSCLHDTAAVRPGQRRGDLLRTFTTEGGISHPSLRRFLHKKCTLLHITVHFELMDPTGRSEDPTDIITKVEGPYLAPFFPG